MGTIGMQAEVRIKLILSSDCLSARSLLIGLMEHHFLYQGVDRISVGTLLSSRNNQLLSLLEVSFSSVVPKYILLLKESQGVNIGLMEHTQGVYKEHWWNGTSFLSLSAHGKVWGPDSVTVRFHFTRSYVALYIPLLHYIFLLIWLLSPTKPVLVYLIPWK